MLLGQEKRAAVISTEGEVGKEAMQLLPSQAVQTLLALCN